MKKLILASLMVLGASQAHALTSSGAVWACGSLNGVNYCSAKVTSGTTATQLGRLTVDPSKQVDVFTASNSSTVNGVSTTLNLYIAGKPVGAPTVSATTSGNQIGFTAPYFNSFVVSVTTPANISATNSLTYTVTER